MGKAIAACGHEIKRKMHIIDIKDVITDEDGIHPCVIHTCVCPKCYQYWKRTGAILKNEQEEDEWLKSKV